MVTTVGELSEHETENCLLSNLRDTAIYFRDLMGSSDALDVVIKAIENVMDRELMERFDESNPLFDD